MSDHYERLAAQEIEPIIVMEAISRRDIPEAPRLNIALAAKHILRAGHKVGNDWSEEIKKAENYLHRARTGEWIPR